MKKEHWSAQLPAKFTDPETHDDYLGHADFLIRVVKTLTVSGEDINVCIGLIEGSQDSDKFEYLMCACETLVNKVASRSGAGYEKACELIVEGSMKGNQRHDQL